MPPLPTRVALRVVPRASTLVRPSTIATQRFVRTKASNQPKMSASGTSSGHPIATLDVCSPRRKLNALPLTCFDRLRSSLVSPPHHPLSLRLRRRRTFRSRPLPKLLGVKKSPLPLCSMDRQRPHRKISRTWPRFLRSMKHSSSRSSQVSRTAVDQWRCLPKSL